jgi:hypothetical protein
MNIDAGVQELKTNPLHMITMFVLCIIILGGIKIPTDILKMTGSVPGIILVMAGVFYLFTVSPILGVFGMMAGYGLVSNTNKQNNTDDILSQLTDESQLTPDNQFQVTLEEQIVKNIVPLVQSVTPKHLNFKYTQDNTYSAANAI